MSASALNSPLKNVHEETAMRNNTNFEHHSNNHQLVGEKEKTLPNHSCK